MRTRTTIALLFLLALTAGCGRGTISQGGSDASGGDEPWGRTFLSTSVTENGQPKPLVEGTRISLRFSDGHELGAQAGCNSMGGRASFEAGRLVVGDLATTEMGCDPARHAQDEWLARFLTSRPRAHAGHRANLKAGTLTLENDSSRVVLADREVAQPDRSLRDTKWVVDTIVEGESASSVPAGAEAHVIFGDGDRFGGDSGCNSMGGNAVVHDDTHTITFSEVVTTKMACEDDRMRLERAVLATLEGDVAYGIEADVLRLDGPDGHGLRLRAAKP
jgi:heat shock protein HslJ